MAKKLIKHDSGQFLVFTTNAGVGVEVRYEDGTIWLTQALMAELFDVDVRTVNEHLKTIFSSDELSPEATIRNFRIVRQEGSRQVTRQIQHYNLDAIISVGYRVNSIRATQFRQWAIGILRDFVHEKLADLGRIFKAHLNLAESRAVRHILTRM